MKELTLVEKFDAVLDALYDISGKRPTDTRIMLLLKKRGIKIDVGEVWDIFIKMRQEGLLHQEVKAIYSKRPNEVLHLIHFNGKYLKETNGLKGKLEREKIRWNQKHPVLYTILTAIISAILSLIRHNNWYSFQFRYRLHRYYLM
jgi:hypothetical protein